MKGSKNKLIVIKDYASQIAEKQETIASITANIDTLKADLKEKKAAEEAKKAEAESVVRRLFASGMSADEILEKLK
mgnify:CR=1 FL=1